MGTPRVTTGDLESLAGATEAVMETPRVTTGDLETPVGATSVVMVNPTTTAMLDRKLPMEATLPVKSCRMITLTGAVREAMVDPTINLVPTVKRRNPAVVRGCDRGVRNVC